ncbi:MAG: hypothetical protein ACRC5T_05140, partial [Cetobacterium sp.]
MIILNNGDVWAWGDNIYGRLGVGSAAAVVTKPTKVIFPAGVKIVDVKSVRFGSVFYTDEGDCWVCGMNTVGGLNPTNTLNCTIPILFRTIITPEGEKRVVDIFHVEGLVIETVDKEYYFRGRFHGGLNIVANLVSTYTDYKDFTLKTPILPDGGKVVKLFTVNYSMYWVSEYGEIYVIGFRYDNNAHCEAHGQLGQGSGIIDIHTLSPLSFKFPDEKPTSAIKNITGGAYMTFFEYENGDIFITGYTNDGDIYNTGYSLKTNAGGYLYKSKYNRKDIKHISLLSSHGFLTITNNSDLQVAGRGGYSQLFTGGTSDILSPMSIYLEILEDGEFPVVSSNDHDNYNHMANCTSYILTNRNRVIVAG